MKCLTCHQPITEKNRATYRFGLNLPYCQTCVVAFKEQLEASKPSKHSDQITEINKRLSAMDPARRKLVEKVSRRKLKQMGMSDQDIEQAFSMTNMRQKR